MGVIGSGNTGGSIGNQFLLNQSICLAEEKRLYKQQLTDKYNKRERSERSGYFRENHEKMKLLKKYGIDTIGMDSRISYAEATSHKPVRKKIKKLRTIEPIQYDKNFNPIIPKEELDKGVLNMINRGKLILILTLILTLTLIIYNIRLYCQERRYLNNI